MSSDPDTDVHDFIFNAVKTGAYVWRQLEANAAKYRKPKPAKTFQQKFGGRAVYAADIARSRSKSPDPVAKDLLAWEAFTQSELWMVSYRPGAKDLPGAATIPRADSRARGARMLRQAYEAETGRSAVDGSALTAQQRAARLEGLGPEWIEEAKLLRTNPGKSKAAQAYGRLVSVTRDAAEGHLAYSKIRNIPSEICH